MSKPRPRSRRATEQSQRDKGMVPAVTAAVESYRIRFAGVTAALAEVRTQDSSWAVAGTNAIAWVDDALVPF